MFVTNVIKYENSKYYVYSEKGKRLSRGYASKEEAEKRLRQIEAFKHMNTNSVRIYTNVRSSQVNETDTHFHIKNIPITKNNSVMNGIYYSANENEKGMPSMRGKPITLGHPNVDGVNVSAKSDNGLDFLSGTRLTQEPFLDGDMWYVNASIDKAKLAAANKEFYDIISSRDDFGVSTGLHFSANNNSGTNSAGDKYRMEAVNQHYDHLAMLDSSEPPAGGEDTMVRGYNSQGEEVEIIVCNMEHDDGFSELIDSLPRSGSDDEDRKFFDIFKKIFSSFNGDFAAQPQNGYNSQETTNLNDGDTLMTRNEMLESLGLAANSAITDEELKTIVSKTLAGNSQAEHFTKEDAQSLIETAVNAAVKPLQEQIQSAQNAEKESKVGAVKALNLGLPESAINAMSATELDDVLAANSQKHVAGHVSAANRSLGGEEVSLLDIKMPGDE